ncbi:MAG: cache domain-containing protein [Deltaproteobacteria bacterium]|nr:cache domain-containing protein [Deltaproteobacteria bacterium]
MRFSLRSKLIANFVLVIAATGAIATIMGARLIGDRLIERAQAKVAQDINSARVFLQNEVDKLQYLVNLTADRPHIRDALARGDDALVQSLLARLQERESLDVLLVCDVAGAVRVRSREGAAVGGRVSGGQAIAQALSTWRIVSGTEVLSAEELSREDPALAARARIVLRPTPRAKPTARTEESSGMMISAAAPLTGERGQRLGVLYAARLLNHDHELVDRIKDTVYRGESYGGRDIGTVTPFLGDVRIATNVRTEGGQRAVGTRVQAEVGERALGDGRPWVERAFVVNGWYLTAYEPIRDLSDKVIGVLYVGMREDKFIALRRQTILLFLGVTLGGMLLATAIAYPLAQSVLSPIRRLVFAAREISSGKFDHRVPQLSRDEIGTLERAFNAMSSAITERDQRISSANEELKLWAEKLEAVVAERTQKLRELEEQLIRSSRLTSLGQLAASVAHEINNPLASVLTYCYVLHRKLGSDHPLASRVEVMRDEISRCARIVHQLLDFARDRPSERRPTDVNLIVSRTAELLRQQVVFHGVDIVLGLAAGLPEVIADAGQIEQVVMNILINAGEACHDGGKVTVTTRPYDGFVELSFSDTGTGIPREVLPKIFDEFFSTERRKGLGLGLSVCRQIVTRHGGTIEVESEPAKGTTFRVRLPVARPELP